MSPPPSLQFSSFLVCGEYTIAKMHDAPVLIEWPVHPSSRRHSESLHSRLQTHLFSIHTSAISPSATCSENSRRILHPQLLISSLTRDHFRGQTGVFVHFIVREKVAVNLDHVPILVIILNSLTGTNSAFLLFVWMQFQLARAVPSGLEQGHEN